MIKNKYKETIYGDGEGRVGYVILKMKQNQMKNAIIVLKYNTNIQFMILVKRRQIKIPSSLHKISAKLLTHQ